MALATDTLGGIVPAGRVIGALTKAELRDFLDVTGGNGTVDHTHDGTANSGGIIPLYARLAQNETVTGAWTFDDDVAMGGNILTDLASITPTSSLLTLNINDALTGPNFKINQAGSGDAIMEFAVAAQSWSMGIDNSALDVFVIGTGIDLTAPAMTIRVAGKLVGIGTTTAIPPAFLLHVRNNSGSTTAILALDQDSTGDATLLWRLTAGQTYAAGIDNSVSGDPYIFVANPGALGKLEVGTTVYTITLTPDWTFNVEAKFDSGIQFQITTTTSNITVGRTNFIVFADSTAGNLTITLPASHTDGDTYIIKNTGSGGNIVTVARNGSNIEGAAADRTLNDLDSDTFTSDGTDWWVSL